ncbi:hypothetical protein B0A50_00598 [Salinomyces thailandicus]|uniref:UBL3-like ubiquitin domain-containing protein n=1 Tax=Salinomyces thailandicus TaxID=706561 RepID=A0A4U0UFR6_9PEZI|nr:hypothetical protein B0A50_00598 [Salinomyces thailandica]
MASQEADPSPTTAPGASTAPSGQHTSPSPVELDALPATTQSTSHPHPVDQVDPAQSTAQPAELDGTSAAAPTPSQPTTAASEQPKSAPALTRMQTEALGPATENPINVPSAATGPVLSITLMLTTGQRHPYKIDEKYLKNRNTEPKGSSGQFDPLCLSGYKLKELIWTDWRNEWEPRPAAPTSIRLIILGKMLEDKKALNDYNFNLEQTNVVHMTVKPADFGEDDEGGTGKHGGKGSAMRVRDGGEGGAGCRCVIL